ncbi:MAG TPA: hypothetical protein VFH47_07200, partial [Candidatus Thermoplasmatota archaeon]|nr:hypothetical protein [Candidatus Thermoplasmatota archaeon]
VAARTEAAAGGGTWYAVEALGDAAAFVSECKRRKHQLRDTEGGLQVLAPDAAAVMAAARASGTVLLSASPATQGVEERVLAHLEVRA